MAPVSAVGAAAPILPTGEDLPPTAKEKTISYWSALMRSSAIKNGHNPDVAEAFINKDKEVKIGDRVVHPKGSVLTLSAQDATERINGRPLLAEGIADSVTDLAKKAGLKGNIVAIEPTGFEIETDGLCGFPAKFLLPVDRKLAVQQITARRAAGG